VDAEAAAVVAAAADVAVADAAAVVAAVVAAAFRGAPAASAEPDRIALPNINRHGRVRRRSTRPFHVASADVALVPLRGTARAATPEC